MNKQWTEEMVIEELWRIIKKLDIERMPTTAEIKAQSDVYGALYYYGSLTYFAEKMGVPILGTSVRGSSRYRKRRKRENGKVPERKSPPPLKKESLILKARHCGTTYAALQILDTQDRCGRIDVSEYEGMKTWKERMQENETE